MHRTHPVRASIVLGAMVAVGLTAPAASAERKQRVATAECLYPVADVALNEAMIKRVIIACTAVIKTRALSDDAYATAYLQRGSMHRRQGKYALAFADFGESIRYDPTSADAYTGRGNARRLLGELDSAIVDHSEAIRLRPNFAMAYSNRGNVWSDKKMFDRAIADYDEAIRLNPDYATAFYNRALAHSDAGDKERAIADYRQALKLNAHLQQAADALKELRADR
jgi:tetratricopeptide (TPR) repeat protein